MNSYQVTTGAMELGTLAGASVIFALSNPAGSGKTLSIRRLSVKGGFVGTAAATRVPVGFARATGTAAAGTASASGASLAKRNPGTVNSIALVRFGPAAVTGLTADAAGDFKTTMVNHQVGVTIPDELVDAFQNAGSYEPIVIAPGTSLVATTRAISVAGTGLALDIEWTEN